MSKSALLLSACTHWAGNVRHFNEDLVEHKERDAGTLFHNQAQSILDTGVYELSLPPNVSRWTEHADKYIKNVLLPAMAAVQSEVPLAINWLTGEASVEPKSGHRNYANLPGWQYGTADVVGITKTGRLYIGDWKTGSGDGAKEQLLSLAVAYRLATENNLGLHSKEHLPVTISCLYVNEDGVWPHEEDISEEELQSHADSMRFVWEDILQGKTVGPNPGVHCTTLYCPHLAYCKAITDATVAMASAAQEGIPGKVQLSMVPTDSPATDEEAGLTQAIVSACHRQTKYLTEANKKRVKDGQRVTFGQYVWEDRGNGFRWNKEH